MRAALGIAAFLALGLWTGATLAQDSGEDAEARALFDAGAVAFEDGRFENALEYFRRAYALSQRPGLLYNIGAAADRMRSDAEALTAFEEYLQRVPDAENRAHVEARIAALRRARERSEADPPADPPRADPTPSTSSSDPAPWIVVASGAAIAVAGAALLTVAMLDLQALEDLPDGSRYAEVRDAADRVPVLSGAGIASLAVGAALAVAGVAWAVVGGGGSSESVTLRVGPTGVALSGVFR